MNIGSWFTPKPSSPGEAALNLAGGGGGAGGGSAAGAAGGGGKKSGDSTSSSYEGSGFDPTGLERAARAAKILNASPHAKNSLEVIQEQERTKQMEYALQQAQYETYKAKLAIEKVGEKYREDTQYLKRQTEEQKKLAEHSNEMERRRELEKLRAQEQLHKKHATEQLALFERQEEMRRKTIEKEATLRRETEMKKVDAEVAGRIRQEKENHDLHIEAAKVKVLVVLSLQHFL
jgi:ATPase family AAA domain-containing protein 3A/B